MEEPEVDCIPAAESAEAIVAEGMVVEEKVFETRKVSERRLLNEMEKVVEEMLSQRKVAD